MPTPPHHRPATRAALALLLTLLAAGCASSDPGPHDSADILHAGRLFVSRDPYRSMFVEIDAVEGAELSPPTVAALRTFLEKYCDKPDGITLRCNPPYPVADNRTAPSCTYLALTQGHGPPPGPPTAYLHILVYDSRHFPHHPHTDNPRFTSSPYPALIYFDRAYHHTTNRDVEQPYLLHELGHALGLAANPAHGNGTHCADPHCLMYYTATLSTLRQVFRVRPLVPDKDLCPQCQADLAAARTSPPDPNTSFVGACFLRREQGYWVATLPGAVAVSFDPAAPPDPDELARHAATRLRGHTDPDSFAYGCSFPKDPLAPPALAAIDRAKRDPAWQVRVAANDPTLSATTRPSPTSQPTAKLSS